MREADDRAVERTRSQDGGDPAVRCDELVVRYGPTVAVRGLTFRAERGEVVALLGPNGAGKTSTVECLEGYRPAASGTASVLGLDPRRDHPAVVARLGVMLQRGGVYPMLGPSRLLHLFAGYYDKPADPAELLDRVGLARVAGTPWRRLSGGEQQRLSLALALVGRPEVLFLDEPTAGVDPEGRLAVRDIVEELRTAGVCVVLTTHELGEAERLADRVVIIDRGRKVAEGTPAGLTSSPDGGEIRFGAATGLPTVGLLDVLGEGAAVQEEQPGRYRVALPPSVSEPDGVARLTAWLAEGGHALADLRTGRSLEEAYLAITRAGAEQTTPEPAGPPAGRPSSAGRPASPPWLRAGRRLSGKSAGRHPWGGRPLLSQLRSRALHDGHKRRDAASHARHPRRLPPLLLDGARPPGRGPTSGRLLGARHPGPGRHVDGHDRPRRRHRIRPRLRRPQATGLDPARPPASPLAKMTTVAAVELGQAAVLLVVGLGLGWSPAHGGAAVAGGAAAAMVLGTVAFCGIGLLLAGTLRPLVNLAVLNTLFVVLLLLGGMLVPLSKLPGWLADLARALPASALADALHRTLGSGTAVSWRDWLVLGIWAIAAPVAAASAFRWE